MSKKSKKNVTVTENQENAVNDAQNSNVNQDVPMDTAPAKKARAKRQPKAEKPVKPAKGPRGYTPDGYPVAWLRSMTKDEAKALMEAQITSGVGKKFAVQKPKAEKTGTGRRGYTSHGYPIVWLRRHSHDECMEFLAKGEKPPTGAGTKRVRTSDTGEMVPVSNDDASAGDFSFDLAGVPLSVSVDKRQFTLRMGGHSTYYGTLKGLINGMRDRLMRAGVKKDATAIKSLGDLSAIERTMSKTLETWVADGNLQKLDAAQKAAQ